MKSSRPITPRRNSSKGSLTKVRRSSSSHSLTGVSATAAAAASSNSPLLAATSTPTNSYSSGGEEEPEVKHVEYFLDNRLPSDYFKQDVLKLLHDLKIPKWKAVDPATMAKDIVISRISGALTNAVYCVEPPPYLRELIKAAHTANVIGGVDQVTGAHHNPFKKTYHYKVPHRVLLRVYGPQASNLIDRDAELAVLARLSLRKIGPNLLGTFTNGRFEQFLHARPLTKEELRDPEVSVQIAKRMRELHDGIPLLPEERAKGPSFWRSIKSWSHPARERLESLSAQEKNAISRVLGVDSVDEFYSAIDKYKDWLYEKENLTDAKVQQELVFAHNDTQYGNLLRLLPPPGSPLLRPRNEHKQIVVIDFEYSGANVRGVDIANQFCEWMSDYHHPEHPHFADETKFPTREEQLNLIQGYVEHGSVDFDEDKMALETEQLFRQAELWRPAVNAHWCIWGIVQAVVDHKEDEAARLEQNAEGQYRIINEQGTSSNPASTDNTTTTTTTEEEVTPVLSSTSTEEQVEDEQDLFDYFGYSAQKAQLFWADLIKFGVIKPDEYKGELKHINY